MQTAEIFKALGEPTRQQIANLLAERDLGVGELASHFPISRPAVAKHLALMRRCGVLEMQVRGREHIHSLRRDKIKQAEQWLQQMSQFWDVRLDALQQAVENTDD
jgi:DNA-binding transcriptional ArsR family regulator